MKKIVLLFVVMCLVLTLSGCHGSASSVSFTVPEEFDTTRNYELTFWAKNDTNIRQVNAYNKAKEEFEALYPNITINIKFYTDYTRIYNDVITNITTDTTPNICITYPDHIATYNAGKEIVVAVDGLMNDLKYGLGGTDIRFDSPKTDEIVPQFLDEMNFNGHYYGLPFMRSTEAVYVNEDLVKKLGYELPEILTWDLMYEIADKAVIKDAEGNYLVNGQKTMIPIIYKSTDNMTIQMLYQSDAGYSDESGNIKIFNDTTRTILNDLVPHVRNGAFSTFAISSYPANFLNAGQCIFAIDSTAGSTWMGSKAPLSDISEDKFVEFETGVYPIPQFDTENVKMMSQGPSLCIFNKEDPQIVLASWIFAQYLISNNMQLDYSCTEGYVPVTLKAQNSIEYKDYLSRSGDVIDGDNYMYYDIKIEATKILLDYQDKTFTTPVYNGSASLRLAASEMIESVCKAVRRKQEVDIDKIFTDVTSLYRLNQKNTDDLGPLPTESKILIGTLIVTWISMGAVFVFNKVKNKL